MTNRVEYFDNSFQYYSANGIMIHRVTGPARGGSDGSWEWWMHGERHRYYGPFSSYGGWAIHGNRIK